MAAHKIVTHLTLTKNMPDSPKIKNCENNSEDDSEVELVEETQKPLNNSSNWPQALQDLKNNNNKPSHSGLIKLSIVKNKG